MTTRFIKGMSTMQVVGTTGTMVAASVVAVVGFLSPQIDKVKDDYKNDHDKVILMEASVAKIPSIEATSNTTLDLIRYGIFPRLQLNEEEALRKAKEAEANDKLSKLIEPNVQTETQQ